MFLLKNRNCVLLFIYLFICVYNKLKFLNYEKINYCSCLVVSAYGFSANCVEENVQYFLDTETSCTVTYTNSYGVTFTSTAKTCDETYKNLSPHIEASAPKKLENELKEFEF